ncbi:MAG: hypothetical protein U9P82_05100 [Bacteroidota bacterium]|nr:hypothetical protein [Bacteroidota bacterium]
MKSISEEYSGDCKNGYAHRQGVAEGMDKYDMKGNLKMDYLMAQVSIHGVMEIIMRDNLKKGKNMVKEVCMISLRTKK